MTTHMTSWESREAITASPGAGWWGDIRNVHLGRGLCVRGRVAAGHVYPLSRPQRTQFLLQLRVLVQQILDVVDGLLEDLRLVQLGLVSGHQVLQLQDLVIDRASVTLLYLIV